MELLAIIGMRLIALHMLLWVSIKSVLVIYLNVFMGAEMMSHLMVSLLVYPPLIGIAMQLSEGVLLYTFLLALAVWFAAPKIAGLMIPSKLVNSSELIQVNPTAIMRTGLVLLLFYFMLYITFTLINLIDVDKSNKAPPNMLQESGKLGTGVSNKNIPSANDAFKYWTEEKELK